MPQARAGPARAEVRAPWRQRCAADDARAGDAARAEAGRRRGTTDAAGPRAQTRKPPPDDHSDGARGAVSRMRKKLRSSASAITSMLTIEQHGPPCDPRRTERVPSNAY